MPRYEITIRGIYCADPEIFKVIALPENDRLLPVLQDYILDFYGNLEICYPNPRTMKRMLKTWSNVHQNAWKHLYEALMSEYNPIENYNRMENWSDWGNTDTTANSSANTEDKATAINDYDPKTTNTSSANSNTAGATVEKSGHAGLIHGNIGVTTSQQMIEEEIELREMTFIENVAEDFKHMFCIQVY